MKSQRTEEKKKTTTDLTKQYIKDNPAIRNCLKKGLINYSALSRLVAKDLDIEKKTSQEAILIAARRFRDELKKEISNETKIRDILHLSEIETKNKIEVFILEKSISLESIDIIQKTVRKSGSIFYILEGSDNYTIITAEKFDELISGEFKGKIIQKETGLALITVKSKRSIETTVGVLAYLTALFAENGVNIIEFLSCWTDTLFIINAKDMNKAMGFLTF